MEQCLAIKIIEVSLLNIVEIEELLCVCHIVSLNCKPESPVVWVSDLERKFWLQRLFNNDLVSVKASAHLIYLE